MTTKILRKITIRDVVGSKSEILRIAQTGRTVTKGADGKDVYSADGAPVKLMTVIGRVNGFTPGESDMGSFLKLKGAFEATNLVTGEVFTDVGTCILPNFVSDLMANAMKSGADSVDFAVALSVVFDEAIPTMYKFEAESLLPAQESDSIAAIKAQLAGAGIALPKPAEKAQLQLPDLATAVVQELHAKKEEQPQEAVKKADRKR